MVELLTRFALIWLGIIMSFGMIIISFFAVKLIIEEIPDMMRCINEIKETRRIIKESRRKEKDG